MDSETKLAIAAAGIGVFMTPIYVFLVVKGVRALAGIRDALSRPPGDRGARLPT